MMGMQKERWKKSVAEEKQLSIEFNADVSLMSCLSQWFDCFFRRKLTALSFHLFKISFSVLSYSVPSHLHREDSTMNCTFWDDPELSVTNAFPMLLKARIESSSTIKNRTVKKRSILWGSSHRLCDMIFFQWSSKERDVLFLLRLSPSMTRQSLAKLKRRKRSVRFVYKTRVRENICTTDRPPSPSPSSSSSAAAATSLFWYVLVHVIKRS